MTHHGLGLAYCCLSGAGLLTFSPMRMYYIWSCLFRNFSDSSSRWLLIEMTILLSKGKKFFKQGATTEKAIFLAAILLISAGSGKAKETESMGRVIWKRAISQILILSS